MGEKHGQQKGGVKAAAAAAEREADRQRSKGSDASFTCSAAGRPWEPDRRDVSAF